MLLVVVLVGLNNFLGCYVLCLVYGNGEYFIYGINVLDSVGLCVSLGCMWMNVDDIKVLFSQVKIGMLVWIINQLVKFVVELDGKCYVEVYRLFLQIEGENIWIIVYMLLVVFYVFVEDKVVDDLQLKKVMLRRVGYLVVVLVGVGSMVMLLLVQNSLFDNGLFI